MKINILLTLSLLISGSFCFAEFEQTSRRYLANQDILNSLAQYLPLSQECDPKSIPNGSQSILGFNSVLTGNPISPTPSAMTILEISTCIHNAFARTDSSQFLAQHSSQELLGNSYVTLTKMNNLSYERWGHVDDKFKSALIADMLSSLLGTDQSIKDFGLITDVDQYRVFLRTTLDKDPTISVYQAMEELTINLMTRDEFLSY